MTNEELFYKINKAANIIAKKARESSANYIVVSPKIAEAIENLDIRVERRKKLKKLDELIKKRDSI